ncbi:MAG: N-acetyltransferase [Proteobacteria bacterium]|jgi:amino-acid N-acetyltransferase|nr:N-acetyltransferase [Pseudomonadota bacterium]
MEYVEPPPQRGPDKKKPEEKFRKVITKPKEDSQIAIGKAQIRDVEEILELVNGFAASNLMLPRGPQYLYENIRDFVIASDPNVPVYSMTETREVLNLIVACGSLHVLWEDIAEVRALAIHPDYQHLGLGSKLVEYMKKEARRLGIHRLFTFTMTEEFFSSLGFKKIKRKELPPKVWGECSRCPKYFRCDEVGMVLEL